MQSRENWGSKLGFILASAGGAIGLGSIWKFPYITGMCGGGAFVLVYLVCIALVGLPVMLIEFSVGRKTQLNPVGALKTLAPGTPWFLAGGMGVAAGFIILSYYSVVAGWTIGYIFVAMSGVFQSFVEPAQAAEYFNAYNTNGAYSLATHFIFMALCVFVVIKGIKSGIEKWSMILMPILFVILIILIIRGVTLPNSIEGLNFIFKPDFSKITTTTVLQALGLAFFSLSLGMGAMVTYGSYLARDNDMLFSAVTVIMLDTIASLMAGVAIFTAVFSFGTDPAAGPALIFHVLPTIFPQIPGGYFFGIMFFILLVIAALASGISLMEVVTAYYVDQKGWSRPKATVIFGSLIAILGIPSALSAGLMANVKVFGLTCFDFMDYVSNVYMLPLGGFLLTIFVAFKWGVANFIEELKQGNAKLSLKPAFAMGLIILSGLLILATLISGIIGTD